MDVKEHAKRFSDALVSEIKAEMGRQDFSSRALGRAIGKSSQYMSDRLDGGSPKTGERVTLNVRDLSAIAAALNLTEEQLVARANVVASGVPAPVVSLSDRRAASALTAFDEIDEVGRVAYPGDTKAAAKQRTLDVDSHGAADENPDQAPDEF